MDKEKANYWLVEQIDKILEVEGIPRVLPGCIPTNIDPSLEKKIRNFAKYAPKTYKKIIETFGGWDSVWFYRAFRVLLDGYDPHKDIDKFSDEETKKVYLGIYDLVKSKLKDNF